MRVYTCVSMLGESKIQDVPRRHYWFNLIDVVLVGLKIIAFKIIYIFCGMSYNLGHTIPAFVGTFWLMYRNKKKVHPQLGESTEVVVTHIEITGTSYIQMSGRSV